MNQKLLRFRLALFLNVGLLLILLGNSRVLAQGITTSSINGLITDSRGAVLPGATIVAVHTPSGTRYGTITNTQGRYNLPAVRIGGPYQLTVTFVGFQEQTRELVSAELNTPVVANFTLTEQGQELTEVVITSQRGSISTPTEPGLRPTYVGRVSSGCRPFHVT